jgi:hypothetical protein
MSRMWCRRRSRRRRWRGDSLGDRGWSRVTRRTAPRVCAALYVIGSRRRNDTSLSPRGREIRRWASADLMCLTGQSCPRSSPRRHDEGTGRMGSHNELGARMIRRIRPSLWREVRDHPLQIPLRHRQAPSRADGQCSHSCFRTPLARIDRSPREF